MEKPFFILQIYIIYFKKLLLHFILPLKNFIHNINIIKMYKIGILLLICLFYACSPKYVEKGTAQTANHAATTYKVNTIAFYNLENLYDTINDPTKNDEASPIMELPKKMRGKVYWKKLNNMAKVISQIGVSKTNPLPPAVIGVSEVENDRVLNDLVHNKHLARFNYGFIHYPSPDERSIDVALLYRKKLFTPISSSPHEVVLYRRDNHSKRDFTRDVLLATGILDGDTLNVMVNHWPSRYGGEKASRPSRVKAAKVVNGIVDSLQAINPYAKILIMGDLNDDPYNVSVKKVLGAKGEEENVAPEGLYNPMENMLEKQGLGTLGYHDSWDLFDQIILSKPLLSKDYSSYRFYKAGIYNPSYLLTPRGQYKGYPFRSYSDGHFTGGYSDHLPVFVYLIKAVK